MNRLAYRLLPCVIAGSLLAAGCTRQTTRPTPVSSSQATTSGTTTATSHAARSTSSSSSTSANSNASTSTPSASATTGIPACDDYLASYKGCHRAAHIYAPDTIDAHYQEMRDTLLRESKDSDKRSLLAARCTSLSNQLKQALHGKACEPEQPATAATTGSP